MAWNSYADGQFHHYTVVRDQGHQHLELFIDGRSKGKRTIDTSLSPIDLTALSIDEGKLLVGHPQEILDPPEELDSQQSSIEEIAGEETVEVTFTRNPLTVDQPGLVVNHYTALTGNAAADSGTITVADAGEFSTGDQVMVIQMQHNTQAGNYEFNTVKSVTGNAITVNTGLTHNYHQDTATTNASRAQVVKVPRYNLSLIHI